MRKQPGIVRRGERWKVTYDLGCDPVTGRRRQRAKTFSTYEEAKAWRAGRVADVTRGVRVDAGGLTLGAYLDEWLETSPRRRGEATRKGLRSVIGCHLVGSPIAGMRLRDLAPRHAAAYYATLPEKGTIRFRVHSMLSRALREAVRLELIARNPVEGLTQPYERVKTGDIAYWSAEELGAFLRSVRQAPPVGWSKRRPRQFTGMYTACHLGLHSGMRLGELLSLGWAATDLDQATVGVTAGKTRHSRRTIEVDDETVSVLRARRREQLAECGRVEGVFTYSDGASVSHGAFQGWFERAVKHAGVGRLTPHGMRHTHAAMMLQEWDIFYVSRRLGHSSVQVTDITYGHLVPAGQRSRVGRSFAEIVGGR